MAHVADHDDEFATFVRQSWTGLRLNALVMCGDPHLAEDLAQDALLVIYQRWPQIAPASRVKYARITMRNRLSRNRGRSCSRHETAFETLPESSSSGEEGEKVARRLAIEAALCQLSNRERLIVYLRYWPDMSTDQIALFLSVPVGTVRSSLSRAAARLRPLLRELI